MHIKQDKSKSELYFFILACHGIRLNNFGWGNGIHKQQNDINNFLLFSFMK